MNSTHDVSHEKILIGIESEEERTKKNKINIKNLIKKKFQFISAFDQKGAKNFLNSKKKALEKIILNDEDSIDNENQNENIKHRKTSKKKKLVKNKTSEGRKNNIRSSTNLINLKKRNHKSVCASNISKNLNKRNTSNKTNNLNQKAHKFFSSQELKMFKDKNIKKIKSIKKSEKRKSKNIEKDDNLSFYGKNDSSIFELLYELK